MCPTAPELPRPVRRTRALSRTTRQGCRLVRVSVTHGGVVGRSWTSGPGAHADGRPAHLGVPGTAQDPLRRRRAGLDHGRLPPIHPDAVQRRRARRRPCHRPAHPRVHGQLTCRRDRPDRVGRPCSPRRPSTARFGLGLLGSCSTRPRPRSFSARRVRLGRCRLHGVLGGSGRRLTLVFLTQLLPSSVHPIRPELKALVYQALV